ncbi:MAG: phosphoenolpyruvate--protein phosphotransferase [Anaerolineales bacterium]
MIGLVLVSHSHNLAEALVQLVGQVTPVDIPTAIAGGVGENRQEFGTDAVEIMDAIQSVYSDEGVLVLMDLGSAILSTEMAVELLPPEMAEKIRFCAAPIVEGAVAAGVQIGLGADLDTACEEARTALLPKIEQIHGSEQIAAIPKEELAESPEDQIEKEEVILTLVNLHGLHARPAARFVQVAASHKGEVYVTDLTNQKGPVTAKSLNAVTTLGAVKDHQIKISASGAGARNVLEKLSEMVQDGFGEPAEIGDKKTEEYKFDRKFSPERIQSKTEIKGVPVSEGAAIAPLSKYRPPVPRVPSEPTDDPVHEWTKFEGVLENVAADISKRKRELVRTIGESESEIFDAHLLILKDPEILENTRKLVFNEKKNASQAWNDVISQTANVYKSLDDEYLQQRAADVMDVGNQVLFALAGGESVGKIEFDNEVILYAPELTPTQTSQLDMQQVRGIITTAGGPTSHSAILAKALSIPAITGVNAEFERLPDGIEIALDGFSGDIWIEPDETVKEKVSTIRREWLDWKSKLIQTGQAPAFTKDGTRIEVVANVGNLRDAETAIKNGAEGIGLLRTEFLFLTSQRPPTEEEQYQTLREIGEAMSADGDSNRPIIVRTLDVGGDKDLPYVDLPKEDNPFLGVRALRLSLKNPDMFKTQLRAILRAGSGLNFKIMFPMVTNLDEVNQARRFLEEAHNLLDVESIPHKWPIETGIMIEIPAAAILSNQIASEVDFFSIGTNDLTQYTLAAERGNPGLSQFNDALHPAVMHLVKQVCDAAHKADKWVGVCGESAGDPIAAPVLIGLGVDELSMNPGVVPRIKAILNSTEISDARELAEQVLRLNSALEARKNSRDFLLERLGSKLIQ